MAQTGGLQLSVTGESVFTQYWWLRLVVCSCQLLVKACSLSTGGPDWWSAVVRYWWKCVHSVLVAQTGGLQLSDTGESVFTQYWWLRLVVCSCQLLVKVCSLSTGGSDWWSAVVSFWWKCVHSVLVAQTGGLQLSVTGESVFTQYWWLRLVVCSCQLLVKVCSLSTGGSDWWSAVVSYWWKCVHSVLVAQTGGLQLSVTGESVFTQYWWPRLVVCSCQLLVKVCSLSAGGSDWWSAVVSYWWKAVHSVLVTQTGGLQLSVTGESAFTQCWWPRLVVCSCQLLVKVCSLSTGGPDWWSAVVSYWWKCVHSVLVAQSGGLQLSVTGESVFTQYWWLRLVVCSCQLLVKVCSLSTGGSDWWSAVVSYWWKCVHSVLVAQTGGLQLSVTGESVFTQYWWPRLVVCSCQLLVKVCSLSTGGSDWWSAVVSYWWKCVHSVLVAQTDGLQLSVTGESVFTQYWWPRLVVCSCQLLVKVCSLSTGGSDWWSAVVSYWWKCVHSVLVAQTGGLNLPRNCE